GDGNINRGRDSHCRAGAHLFSRSPSRRIYLSHHRNRLRDDARSVAVALNPEVAMIKRILLLLLVATAVHAQDSSFFFVPSYGSTAGGSVIRFVFYQTLFGSPRVLFDGVESPLIKVIDAKSFTAVTPPHAEGIVDVTVMLSTASFSTPRKFGYERPREPLLA